MPGVDPESSNMCCPVGRWSDPLVRAFIALLGAMLVAPVPAQSAGSLVAWGNTAYGLGNLPGLPPGRSFDTLASGTQHTLVLLSDGSIFSWGANNSGQLNVPALPPGLRYTAVAAGAFFG